MKIGIDIDDTIIDTYETLTPLFCKKYNCDEKFLDGRTGDYPEVYGISLKVYDDFLKEFLKKTAFNIPIKDSVVDVINKLKDDNEIIFITARSDDYFYDTELFCESFLNFNNIYFDKVIANAKNKGKICAENNIDLLIDDNVVNCKSAIDYNVNCLLFDSKINQGCNDFKRVYNWNEIYLIISNFNNVVNIKRR